MQLRKPVEEQKKERKQRKRKERTCFGIRRNKSAAVMEAKNGNVTTVRDRLAESISGLLGKARGAMDRMNDCPPHADTHTCSPARKSGSQEQRSLGPT